MTLYYFILFILWLCFWSFSTVLISRWYSGQGGIMMWRSECPHCQHILTARELVPLFSWIFQWGKCANCHTRIPAYYPLSEIFMGWLFVWSWWISLRFGYTWEDMMWWVFLFWTFVTAIYVIYDIRYMEIPDQIVVPGIIITLGLILGGLISEEYNVFFDYSSYDTFHTFLTDHIASAIFLYSFFFLQILIPWAIFLYKQRLYTKILELILSYFTFPITLIIDFFRRREHKEEQKDIDIEIPTWIGWGDLRIAFFIGLTLWGIHSITTLIFAYVIGSIVWVSMLIHGRFHKRQNSHEIAFWPFLGIGWILSLTFYSEILDYVNIFYL